MVVLMSDPFAPWWVDDLLVAHMVDGELTNAFIVTGFYQDNPVYAGGVLTSSGRFAFPATEDRIAVGSVITLPAEYGENTVTVAAVVDPGVPCQVVEVL